MPSGAKKRKAAKRKKGKQAQLNISLGSDDLKTIDEKESDGGEVGTPTSPGSHSFMESEEEEKSEVPPRSIDSENKSMSEVSGDGERTHDVVIEDEGIAQLDGELKSERDFENKNGEETYDRFSSSSSSSSSDDEGQVVEETSVVEELETAEELDDCSALEGEPLVDLNENPEVPSLPEEVNHVNGHASVEIHVLPMDVFPVINPVNPDVSVNENKFLETKNVDDSVEDTMSYVNPNVSLNEKLLASDNVDLCVENTSTSDTFVPDLKENGGKVQPELDDSSLGKPLDMEVKMTKDEEITCPILEETIVPLLSAVNSTSSAVNSTSKENVHELLSSSDAQTESWNGAVETTTPEVDLELNKNVEIVPSVPEGYKEVTLKTETCAAEETINAEVNLASNEIDPSVSEGYEGVTLNATDYSSKANEGTLPRDTPFHDNNNGTEVLQIGKTLEEAVDVLIPMEQDTVVSSSVIDLALKEIEDKQLQSLNDSTTETNNDAANTNNSVKSEGLQVQTPPVTTQLVTPLPKAQIPWMSCCGLFDLFMGSNR